MHLDEFFKVSSTTLSYYSFYASKIIIYLSFFIGLFSMSQKQKSAIKSSPPQGSADMHASGA
jgi:hypothetical protein